MQRYLLQRLLLAAVSVLGLTLLVFVFLRAIPGDTAVLVLGADASSSPQQVAIVRHHLHLDDPLPQQYVRWLGGILHGDLGRSLFTTRLVWQEIRDRLATTLELASLTLACSLVAGVTTGTFAALRHGRAGDQAVRLISILGLAVPNFWLGTMVIVFGARWFGWIPPVQYTAFWHNPGSNLQMFVVPALVIGMALAASLSRMTRSAVLDVAREDYVRTARAKGLSPRVVLVRHTLRSALIPILTLFAVQVGAVVAGTVVIENVFSLPGLGRLILDSITRKDFPLVQGIVLLYGCFIVLANLFTDLLYGVIDPRIRLIG
jgi:peptide/nickel transport system permease protein